MSERAEGFWWVRERGAEGWTTAEVRASAGGNSILLLPGESRFMLPSNPALEWGPCLGKGPEYMASLITEAQGLAAEIQSAFDRPPPRFKTDKPSE
jgi:hypothetical protein